MRNDREINKNDVRVCGTVAGEIRFNHEVYGEEFFTFDVVVKRQSGTEDIIPCMVSAHLCDIEGIQTGALVEIYGQFRSRNYHGEGKNKLILNVFVEEIQFPEESECEDDNSIMLDGYLCRQPVYRKTPLGREVADLLVAVNRPYGKSDYIPCICWSRNAKYISRMEVGTHVILSGRIQSRQYTKRYGETVETHTAYEVSVSKVEKGE